MKPEVFRLLRDACVLATGSWSANQIFEHAKMLDYKARRAQALAEIKAACGDGLSLGGRRQLVPEGPVQLVPNWFPEPVVTGSATGSQKKKKEAKKKKSSDTAPMNTSYSSPPEFGELEPEIVTFLAVVAAENKSGQITVGRAFALRRELQEALEESGDPRAFVYGLRAAIAAGAGNVNYARKAMKSYMPTGSATGSVTNGNGAYATGSRGNGNGVVESDGDLPTLFELERSK